MRIALVTYSTRPRGGVVHTLALAEALAALGQDVSVWAVDRSDGAGFFRAVDPAVSLELVACAPCDDVEERILRSIAALHAAIDPAAYDVVHAQDCISANAVSGCLRTVHHVDHFTSAALVACHGQAIRSPRALICVSDAVAQELERDWDRRATVIPNGVDAARFAAAASADGKADRAAWRRRLGDGPIVLTVGGIEPRKGSLELLEAVARVRDREPHVRLVIAGGETLFDYREYRAAFEQRRRRLGLDVEVLGPVPDAELPALVACADAFALTSSREGFGLAAMEALAARIPVVLRDGPVLGRVFAGAALFGTTPAELARALAVAIREPDDERLLRGVELSERHTWAAAAASHLDEYRRLGPVPRPTASAALA
jgi:glycosyltransferase-like protein